MNRILLAAILQIDLPEHTVRLVDGGTLPVDGATFSSRDDVLGVPKEFVALTEGVGDEAPAGVIVFLVPPEDEVPASALTDPAWQGSRVRTWIAEVDAETGTVIGTPDQQSDWIIDQTILRQGDGPRELDLVCISHGQRLLEIDRGNSLSPSFHKSIHPGETGLDNGVGVSATFPWAAAQAPRGIR